MPPYFSIIIPTYNSEKDIENCLKSILEQTFSDFEVLVMDGCSQDKTVVIAGDFKDERIKLYSEKDTGIYDAMNKGIEKSKGKWVFFLGSDDIFYNKHVLDRIHSEIILKYISYDIIYGSVMFKGGGKYAGQFNRVKLAQQNICHQAIFYNRIIFDKYGTYNLKYPILADWEFNLRVFLNRRTKTAYVDLIVSEYDGGGLSFRNKDEKFMSDKYDLVKKYGLTTLPIMYLRKYCKTKRELFMLIIERTKRLLY